MSNKIEYRQMQFNDMVEMQRLLNRYSVSGDKNYLQQAADHGKRNDKLTYENYMYK